MEVTFVIYYLSNLRFIKSERLAAQASRCVAAESSRPRASGGEVPLKVPPRRGLCERDAAHL